MIGSRVVSFTLSSLACMIRQTADWRQQPTPFTLQGDTSSIPIDPVKTNVMLLPLK